MDVAQVVELIAARPLAPEGECIYQLLLLLLQLMLLLPLLQHVDQRTRPVAGHLQHGKAAPSRQLLLGIGQEPVRI